MLLSIKKVDSFYTSRPCSCRDRGLFQECSVPASLFRFPSLHPLFYIAPLLIGALLSASQATAADDTHLVAHAIEMKAPPAAIAVHGTLPPLPATVTELKFGEMFKMPIGPRGLDASAKLLSLSGKQVRLLGYMARAETPVPGMFILTPLPVSLGDEDESLSDDLPASSIFVHLDAAGAATALPFYPGLLQLTGTLLLGPHDEADGHVSTVRLQLDAALTQVILPAIAPTIADIAAKKSPLAVSAAD
jgi:hypothetical protein